MDDEGFMPGFIVGVLCTAVVVGGAYVVVVSNHPKKPDPVSTVVLKQVDAAENAERIEVRKIGEFQDATSYAGKRVVYEIWDAHTESRFIGVTGVGISEVGSHKVGKQTVEDER